MVSSSVRVIFRDGTTTQTTASASSSATVAAAETPTTSSHSKSVNSEQVSVFLDAHL